METLTVNPKQLAADLVDLINSDTPSMIWGSPGIGKSQVVAQTAERLTRTVFDVRGNVKEAPDFSGYLCLTECRPGQPPKMTAPADLPPMDYNKPSILFLDEINGSSRDVQSCMYGLVLERRINSYKLPADCRIVAAGNLASDRGVVQPMPTPLKNRFVHLVVQPDVEQWLNDYAIPRNLHPFVTGYHSFKKSKGVQELMIFDPKSEEPAFASPRSWEAISRILYANPNPSTALIHGTLGSGVGSGFAGYCQDAASLPPAELVWLNPNNAPLPIEPSALFAVSAMLASAVTIPTMPQFVAYISRFTDKEFSFFAMDAATRRSAALAQCVAFQQWAKEHAYILGLTS